MLRSELICVTFLSVWHYTFEPTKKNKVFKLASIEINLG